MKTEVYKFGGASVKDADALRIAANIIKAQKNRHLLVVVSAMGKTTNELEYVFYTCEQSRAEGEEKLNEVFNGHLNIVEKLFDDKDNVVRAIERLREDALEKVRNTPFSNRDYFYDQLVSYGELLSSTILSYYLSETGMVNEWFDARKLIKTDYNFRQAVPDMVKTDIQIQNKLLPFFKSEQPKLAVTQGFIAGADTLNPTTLGREGSDYSAALLGYFLNAECITIWKDVDGVLNADPKYFSDTTLLSNISYREAIELAYFGASVIHPKTIQPLKEKGIPLYVKSFYKPEAAGTLIDNNTAEDDKIPSYIFRKKQRLISISTSDFSFVAENHLSDIFQVFSKHGTGIHIMQNSAVNFSVCTDDTPQCDDLIAELQKRYKVLYNKDLELITIRHYDRTTIEKLTQNKTMLLEQKTRNTARILLAGG